MDQHKTEKGIVFGYRRKDGTYSDENVVDEMLQDGNELRIRRELIDSGIIAEIVLTKVDPDKP